LAHKVIHFLAIVQHKWALLFFIILTDLRYSIKQRISN